MAFTNPENLISPGAAFNPEGLPTIPLDKGSVLPPQTNPELPPNPSPVNKNGAKLTGSTLTRLNQKYIFNVFIQTSKELNEGSIKTEDGRIGKSFPINPEAIHQLVIEEDILNWYTKGFIIFKNVMESYSATANSATNLGLPSLPGRGDARELLIIQIQPSLPDGSAADPKLPVEGWCLKYDFVVYDSEDIDTEDPTVKLKKLYFRDFQFQFMTERNLQFSTATLPNATKDGTILTSEAIRHLLNAANEPIGGGQIDFNNWQADGPPIFYTSPAPFYALDDLYYLLNRHVSTSQKNDLCLFGMDRFTKQFQLTPFSKIFEYSTAGQNPGKYQIEHLFIQNYVADQKIPTNVYVARAPLDKTTNNPSKDTKLGSFSSIYNYRFVDMAGADNAKTIINRVVCSYDFSKKTFNIESKDGGVQNTKDYFKTSYTDKLFGKNKTPLMTLNQTKTKFFNISPVWSTKSTKESRLMDGRNKTLFSAIYLNECISFKVMGSTNRQPGKFIGIDKLSNDTILTDFENKFLGQWFVTKVKHIFTRDTYYNDMLAVKIHSYEDLRFNEAVP